MLKNDTTVLFEPLKLVRASGRVPKPLKFVDKEGDGQEYVIEPLIEGSDMKTAKIFYIMPAKFARMVLGENLQRFKLCEPSQMTVPFKNNKIHDVSWKIVKSIGVKPKIKEMSNENLEKLFEGRALLTTAEQRALKDGKIAPHIAQALEEMAEEKKKEEDVAEKSKSSSETGKAPVIEL